MLLYSLAFSFLLSRCFAADKPNIGLLGPMEKEKEKKIASPKALHSVHKAPACKWNETLNDDVDSFVLIRLGQKSVEFVVFVLADDQDVKLGSLKVQDKIQKLLTDEGLFFNNAFVTTPVCCPSRASILTGRYPHNTGTYENTVVTGCSSPSWRERNEHTTIGPFLSSQGYMTGFFGKYLNLYAEKASGVGPEHVPPGWTKWFGLVGNSKYYNYDVSNDGVREHHGDSYEKDYFPDLIKNETVTFIEKTSTSGKPFFMYVAPPAPHRPATPAPQYNKTFSGKLAPRTPSYGFQGKDKHWIISQGTPVMDNFTREQVDLLYEGRLGTLLSVQDMVEEIVNTLENLNILKNTFVFYFSDHGYHLGQFNQRGEKRQPYEEDIRVPFIVRGPGVKRASETDHVVLSIDLFPTFLDIAGVDIPSNTDGRSLKDIILGTEEGEWRNDFMVEYYGEGDSKTGCFVDTSLPKDRVFLHDCHNNTFLALRTISEMENSTFTLFYKNDSFPLTVSNHNFVEYYDIDKDNWQLVNTIQEVPSEKIQQMKERLTELYKCSGSACH